MANRRNSLIQTLDLHSHQFRIHVFSVGSAPGQPWGGHNPSSDLFLSTSDVYLSRWNISRFAPAPIFDNSTGLGQKLSHSLIP